MRLLSLFGSSTPAFDLQDKVVIVTGSSSGIGRALARELAQKGAQLVLAARRAEQLQETLQELPNLDRHITVPTDITKEADCQNLIQKTIEKYGKLDVLINNAGISQTLLFEEYDDLERYHAMMNTNYFGTLNCTHAALKHLKASQGMIVAVTSMCGKLGVPHRTGYCASKYAVHGFLDALRTELIDTGVHILIACPGYVKTEIRAVADGADDDPINQDANLMTPDECAAAIREAVEQKRREVLVVSSFAVRLAPYLRWFVPDTVDRVTVKKAKGGRT